MIRRFYNFWRLYSHPFFKPVHSHRKSLKNNNVEGVFTHPYYSVIDGPPVGRGRPSWGVKSMPSSARAFDAEIAREAEDQNLGNDHSS